MNIDYTYCKIDNSCIHRRGCKRWIGNYEDEAVKELNDSGRASYLDCGYCMDSVPYKFDSLDRFRNSDGSPSKI